MKNIISIITILTFVISSLYSYTYQNKDGNPFVEGQGNLSEAEYLDISLNGKPLWISSIAGESAVYSVVVLENGSSQIFKIEDNRYEDVSEFYDLSHSTGKPPVLSLNQDKLEVHFDSVFLSDGTIIRLSRGEGLYIGEKLIDVHPLPDSRILVDEKDRILLFADPTERYNHGVLGDHIEAESVVLIETKPELVIKTIITIKSPEVIEGIKPLWVDLNRDGEREIIVTVSDIRNGAGLVLFDESGDELARSSFIGMGYRWRHQLTAGPYGPDGEMEILDVMTPHIGGPLEFFRWSGKYLKLFSTIGGFTSHVMGSGNLDMTVGGDFNGNNISEIIAPAFNRSELGAIERNESGSIVVYRLGLSGRITTNLSSFRFSDGRISLAVGMDNNVMRIWLPDIE
jgi:WD40 repeat protein